MNYKIGKIKLYLLKEEFIKQIKDSYTLNLSMVLLEEFENLQQENRKQKEVIDRLNFIKNRKNQGASQENINKMAIEFVNSYLKKVE